MSVHVMIKRKLKTTNPERLMPILAELRARAVEQPGYISGETLRSIDDPDDFIVVSRWETADDWKNWLFSKERRDIQYRVDVLIGEKTFYDVYETMG